MFFCFSGNFRVVRNGPHGQKESKLVLENTPAKVKSEVKWTALFQEYKIFVLHEGECLIIRSI